MTPRIIPPEEAKRLADEATPGPLSTEMLLGQGNDLLTAILARGVVVGSTLKESDAQLFIAAHDLAHTAIALWKQTARLRKDLEVLVEQRQAVLALHVRSEPPDDIWCEYCSGLWPCATARALGVTDEVKP